MRSEREGKKERRQDCLIEGDGYGVSKREGNR